MKSRKYESYDAALDILSKEGQLKFFGRGGVNHAASIYRLDQFDGHSYVIFLYGDGTVEVISRIK